MMMEGEEMMTPMTTEFRVATSVSSESSRPRSSAQHVVIITTLRAWEGQFRKRIGIVQTAYDSRW